MSNIIASMTATIDVSKEQAFNSVVSRLNEMQKVADENSIKYTLTGGKEQLDNFMKQIDALSPEVKAGLVLDFDASKYQKELTSLQSFAGKSAQEIAKELKKGVSDANIDDIFSDAFGSSSKATKSSKNYQQIISDLKSSIESVDLDNITDQTAVLNQLTNLEKLKVVLTDLKENGKISIGSKSSKIDVLDELKNVNSSINSFSNQAGASIYENLNKWIEDLGTAYTTEFNTIKQYIQDFNNEVANIGSGSGSGNGNGLSVLDKQISKVIDDLEKAKEKLEELNNGTATTGSTITLNDVKDAYSNLDSFDITTIQDYYSKLQQYVAQGGNLTQKMKNQYNSLKEDFSEGFIPLNEISSSNIAIDETTSKIEETKNTIKELENELKNLEEQRKSNTGSGSSTDSGSGTGSIGADDVVSDEAIQKTQQLNEMINTIKSSISELKTSLQTLTETEINMSPVFDAKSFITSISDQIKNLPVSVQTALTLPQNKFTEYKNNIENLFTDSPITVNTTFNKEDFSSLLNGDDVTLQQVDFTDVINSLSEIRDLISEISKQFTSIDITNLSEQFTTLFTNVSEIPVEMQKLIKLLNQENESSNDANESFAQQLQLVKDKNEALKVGQEIVNNPPSNEQTEQIESPVDSKNMSDIEKYETQIASLKSQISLLSDEIKSASLVSDEMKNKFDECSGIVSECKNISNEYASEVNLLEQAQIHFNRYLDSTKKGLEENTTALEKASLYYGIYRTKANGTEPLISQDNVDVTKQATSLYNELINKSKTITVDTINQQNQLVLGLKSQKSALESNLSLTNQRLADLKEEKQEAKQILDLEEAMARVDAEINSNTAETSSQKEIEEQNKLQDELEQTNTAYENIKNMIVEIINLCKQSSLKELSTPVDSSLVDSKDIRKGSTTQTSIKRQISQYQDALSSGDSTAISEAYDKLCAYTSQYKSLADAESVYGSKNNEIYKSVLSNIEQSKVSLSALTDKKEAFDKLTEIYEVFSRISGESFDFSEPYNLINKLKDFDSSLFNINIDEQATQILDSLLIKFPKVREELDKITSTSDTSQSELQGDVQETENRFESLRETLTEIANLMNTVNSGNIEVATSDAYHNSLVSGSDIRKGNTTKSSINRMISEYDANEGVISEDALNRLSAYVNCFGNIEDAEKLFGEKHSELFTQVIESIVNGENALEAFEQSSTRVSELNEQLSSLAGTSVNLDTYLDIKSLLSEGDITSATNLLVEKFNLSEDSAGNLISTLSQAGDAVEKFNSRTQSSTDTTDNVVTDTTYTDSSANIANELEQLNGLKEKLAEVALAIDTKTKAYDNGRVAVSEDVQAEITVLDTLLGTIAIIQEEISKITFDSFTSSLNSVSDINNIDFSSLKAKLDELSKEIEILPSVNTESWAKIIKDAVATLPVSTVEVNADVTKVQNQSSADEAKQIKESYQIIKDNLSTIYKFKQKLANADKNEASTIKDTVTQLYNNVNARHQEIKNSGSLNEVEEERITNLKKQLEIQKSELSDKQNAIKLSQQTEQQEKSQSETVTKQKSAYEEIVSKMEEYYKLKKQISKLNDGDFKDEQVNKLVEKGNQLLETRKKYNHTITLSQMEQIENLQEEYKFAEEYANILQNQKDEEKYSKITDAISKQVTKLNEAENKTTEYYTAVGKLKEEYEYLNSFPSFELMTDSESEKANQIIESFKDTVKELNNISYDTSNKYGTLLSLSGENSNLSKLSEAREMVDNLYSSFKKFGDLKVDTLSNGMVQFTQTIKDADGQFYDLVYTFDQGTGQMRENFKATGEQLSGWGTYLEQLKVKFADLSKYILSFVSVFTVWNKIKEGIEIVKDLDTQITEMQKVSSESLDILNDYADSAQAVAVSIGTTAEDLLSSTADYMRLGKSLQEASKLAKDTNILMNVSEFDDISDATDAMIALTQAFQDLDDMDIIDKLNAVGNNYSISTSDLASSLQTSVSSLVAVGNDLDEAIALTVAGNSVVQDPDSVAGGLRTIALRLVGTEEAREELEDLGEDVDDYIVTTSSALAQSIEDLTKLTGKDGISILDDNGNYKSTYQILLEISEIYDDLLAQDKELGTNKATALIETLAGKNRASIASSILQDPTLLESAYNTSSSDYEDSAQEELDKYMDSIEGHLATLETKWQSMWSNVINRDIINFFIDLAGGALDFIDAIGGVGKVIPTLISIFMQIKGMSVFNTLNGQITIFGDNWKDALAKMLTSFKEFKSNLDTSSFSNFASSLKAQLTSSIKINPDDMVKVLSTDEAEKVITEFKESVLNGKQSIDDYVSSFKNGEKSIASYLKETDASKLSADDLAKATQTAKIEQDSYNNSMLAGTIFAKAGTLAIKAFGVALNMALYIGIGLLLSAIVSGISKMISKISDAKEATDEFRDSFSDLVSTLKTLNDTISDVGSEFETLSEGVSQNGENLSLTSDQYDRYLEISNEIADALPELVSYFDSNGNAVLKNANSYAQLTDAIDKYNKTQAESTLEDVDEDDIYTTFQNNYGDEKATSLFGLIGGKSSQYKANEILSELIEISKKGTDGFSEAYNEIRSKYLDIWNDTAVRDMLEDSGYSDYATTILPYEDITQSQLEGLIDSAETLSSTYETELSEALSAVSDLCLNTLYADSDYYELDEAGRNMAIALISGMNEEVANEISSGDLSKTELVNEVIDSVSNSDFTQLYDRILNYDTSDKSLNKVQQDMEAYTNRLSNYLSDDMAVSIMATIDISTDEQEVEDAVENLVSKGFDKETATDFVANLSASDRAYTLDDSYLDAIDDVEKSNDELENAVEQYNNAVEETASIADSMSDEDRYYGNIDQYGRNVIYWDESNLEKYSDELESLGIKADDVANSISTTLFTSAEISNSEALDGKTIIYSPILPDGTLLDSDTLNQYINAITADAESSDEVLERDKNGLQIGDTFVSGLVGSLTDVSDDVLYEFCDNFDTIFNSVDQNVDLDTFKENIASKFSESFLEAFDLSDVDDSELSELSDEVNDLVYDSIADGWDKEDVANILDGDMKYILNSVDGIIEAYSGHGAQADIYDNLTDSLMTISTLNTDGIYTMSNGLYSLTGTVDDTTTSLNVMNNALQKVKNSQEEVAVSSATVQSVLAQSISGYTAYNSDEDEDTTIADAISDYESDISALQTIMDSFSNHEFDSSNITTLATDYGIAFSGMSDLTENGVAKIQSKMLELNNTINTVLDDVLSGDNYSDEVKSAIQVIIASLDDLSTTAIATTNSALELSDAILSIPSDQITMKDTVDEMSSVSSALSSLDSLYAEFVEDGKDMDISGIESLSDAMKNTSAFEEFAEVLGDSTHSSEELQQAFDDLTTAYVDESGILDIVNSDNQNYITQLLKAQGVVNAQAIVTQALTDNMTLLSAQEEYLEQTGYNLVDATDAEVTAFLQLTDVTDDTKKSIAQYWLEKQTANGVVLSTEEDVDDIMALVEACGYGIDALQAYKSALSATESSNNEVKAGALNSAGILGGLADVTSISSSALDIDISALEGTTEDISSLYDSAISEVQNAVDSMNSLKTATKTSYSGGSSSASASESSSSTTNTDTIDGTTIAIEKLERELSKLQEKLRDTTSWDTQLKIQDQVIAKQKELAQAYKTQSSTYETYYKKLAKNLTSKEQSLVENGDLSKIYTYTSSSDDSETKYDQLSEAMEMYNSWQESLVNYQSAMSSFYSEELNKLSMIESKYDAKITAKQNSLDRIQAKIDLKTSKGIKVTVSDYNKLIAKQKELKQTYEDEYDAIKKEFDSLVASGDIEKGSSAWYEYKEVLSGLKTTIIECDQEIIETEDDAKNVDFTNWESFADTIQTIIDKLESLNDLIDSDAYMEAGDGLAEQFENSNINLKKYLKSLIKTADDPTLYQELLDKLKSGESLTTEELQSLPKNILEEATIDATIKKYQKEADSALETMEDLQSKIDNYDPDVDTKEQLATWKENLATATEAYNDYITSISDLNDSKIELQLDTDNNGYSITQQIEENENSIQELQDQIDYLESTGQTVDISYYKEMLALEQENQNLYSNRKQLLEDYIADCKASGKTETTAYQNAVSELASVNSSLADIDDSILTINKSILSFPIDMLEEINEQLEDAKDALEDLEEQYNSAISAVVTYLENCIDEQQDLRDETEEYYDDLIDALEDEKDTLTESNDERQRTLDLMQAQYDLEKAQNQKTSKIYVAGQGWVYEADQDAINDAQEALDEVIYNNKIAALEDEIDRLQDEKETALEVYDDEIDRLEEIKDSWSDIKSIYEDLCNLDIANSLFGTGWQTLINSGDTSIISDFTDAYLDVEKSIDEVSDQIDTNQSAIDACNDLLDKYDGSIASTTTLISQIASVIAGAGEDSAELINSTTLTSTFQQAWADTKTSITTSLDDLCDNVETSVKKQEKYYEDLDSELDDEIGSIVDTITEMKTANETVTSAEQTELETRLNNLTAFSEKYKALIAECISALNSLNTASASTTVTTDTTSSSATTSATAGSVIGAVTASSTTDTVKYHDGLEKGYVGDINASEMQDTFKKITLEDLEPDEIPAILQKGEGVATIQQQENAIKNLTSAYDAGKVEIPTGTSSNSTSIVFSGDIVLNESITNGTDFAQALKNQLPTSVAQALLSNK